MNEEKRWALEEAGYRLTDAAAFAGMTEAEAAELRERLAKADDDAHKNGATQ